MEETPDGPHYHYGLFIGDQKVRFPTVLSVQHGSGEADFRNIKGIASGLGLTLKELEVAESCGLNRWCLLLRFAFYLVHWVQQRAQQMGKLPHEDSGVAAMLVSAEQLLIYISRERIISWNKQETTALQAIRSEVVIWSRTPQLMKIAERFLEQIDSP